jgi:hypothetical protein
MGIENDRTRGVARDPALDLPHQLPPLLGVGLGRLNERQLRQFPAQRSDLFRDEFEAGVGRVPLVVSRRLGRS